jgi:formyl-CoA transferase
MRVGVAVADLFTGMYTAVAILAALYRRERTGEGAHIDMALLDTQLAVLANQASNYLVSGDDPPRQGNTHPNIVPYQPFDASDRPLVIAVGNDRQFAKLAELAGQPEWATDPRFATNAARVAHRAEIVRLLSDEIRKQPADYWFDKLEAKGIPAGPINRISEAIADVQVRHRRAIQSLAGVPVVGSPVRLDGERSDSDLPPPALGEHTFDVLAALGIDSGEIESLGAANVIS